MKNIRFYKTRLLFIWLLVGFLSPAEAQEPNGFLYGISAAAISVAEVPPTTGVLGNIFVVGVNSNALARDPDTNLLYIITSATNPSFLSLNPATNTTTTISSGIEPSNDLLFASLAFNANAQLFTIGVDTTKTPNEFFLFLVDKQTGALTNRGQITDPAGLLEGGGDIAFAPDGTLYICNGRSIFVVDQTTLVATAVQGGETVTLVGAGNAITGCGFDSSGTLFVSDLATPSTTLSINLTTGASSALASLSIAVTVNDFTSDLFPSTADLDNDGLSTAAELNTHGTDPTDADTDDDGINDGNEVSGAQNTVDGAPTDPTDADSDDDGINDGNEISGTQNTIDGGATNPNDADSDDDNLTDGEEITGSKNNGNPTDPNNADTDGGGLSDGFEVDVRGSNPLDASDDVCNNNDIADNNNDGLSDCEAILLGLDTATNNVTLQGSGTFGFGGCGYVGNQGAAGAWLSLLLSLLTVVFLRRSLVARQPINSIFFSTLLILFLAQPTYALNVQLFRPAPDYTGIVTLYGSDTVGKNNYHLTTYLNFDLNPLEFSLTDDDRLDDVVNQVITADFLLSYGLLKNLDVGLHLPLHYSDIEGLVAADEQQRVNIGDITLTALAQARPNKSTTGADQIGLSVVPFLSLPTGPGGRFLGDPSIGGGLRVVADRWLWQRHYFGANVAVNFREREQITNLIVDDNATANIGYQYLLTANGEWRLFTELFGTTTFRKFFVDENTGPVEILAGARKLFWEDQKLALTLGAGRGFNNGYGAPDVRIFAAVALTLPRQKPLPPEPVLPPVQPPPEPVTPPVKEEVVEKPRRAQLLGENIRTDPIFFDTASAVIKEESKIILDEVFAIIQGHPEIIKVKIEGHTDNRGAPAYNRALSEKRANSVKQYLLDKGISAERLESTGYGPDRPITTNNTREGRAINRRVDFRVILKALTEAP